MPKTKSLDKNQRKQPTKVQGTHQANQTHREWAGKMRKISIGVILVVVLLLAYGFWQFSQGQQKPTPGEETASPSAVNAAPNFSLKDINGTQISLNQYRGKPILVHFMALAGCTGQMNPISYAKLPQLSSIYNKYSDKVAMVSVCVATCAGCDSILANVRKNYSISWILGNDYSDEKLEIIDSYSNYDLYDGTVILIDKSFNVAQVYSPQATLTMLMLKIDQLL